jgi:PAS domain S-box-containing protein
VVFALGLTLTLAAWMYVRAAAKEALRAEFTATTQHLEQTIHQQWERYLDVLLATRGFWMASGGATRTTWQVYSEGLRLQENFPGVQGIGFARRVNEHEMEAHEQAMGAEGFPEYRILPAGKRPISFPIILLEPFDARNRRAFGFDMFSEPVRHEAMRRAGETGRAAASGRVTLVQETDVDVQPGFLVYLPVYKPGMPTTTTEERWAALEGFVYAPYRAHNFMRGILTSRLDMSSLHIEVYDGDNLSPSHLLFDSRPDVPAPASELRDALRVEVAGRPWVVAVEPTAEFAALAERRLPQVVLLGGLAVSSLLGAMTWLEVRRRVITEDVARTIAASETRFRLKIEQSPLAVQLVDPRGFTTYVNPSWRLLWGAALADIEGRSLLNDPRLQEPGTAQRVGRVFAGESVVIGPIRYDPLQRKSDHHARWIRCVLYATRDKAGEVSEVVFMQEDFTERKLAEEELRRAKESAEAANRAKDQFLALLSHELRNPLAPVLTMVDLLEQDGSLTSQEKSEAIDVIRRNVVLEARLIDDLLDVTRIARGKMILDFEVIDAHQVLHHALEICDADIRAKRLHVTVSLAAASHTVRADPARLQQVFWNLIKNAVKFTHDGGRISIRSRNEAAPAEAAHAHPALVVEVEDNGVGIEPQALVRIFNAFEQASPNVTRRFGGLGLGLAISKALVDAHAGRISASSEGTHQGATFTVSLPTVTASVNQSKPSPGGNGGVGARLRILVVEDLDDARRALQLILRRAGQEVTAVASVQEALRAGEVQKYDVLLSDIGLPDGSGLELSRRFRETQPQVVAVALSGLGMEEDIQQSREAGFHYHLTKPVHFGRLQEVLHAVASELLRK